MILWQDAERPSGARVIVGLSTQSGHTFTPSELYAYWEFMRRGQGAKPDATFAETRGLFTYPDGTIGREQSVVITVLNLEKCATFRRDIFNAAESLAEAFGQQEIIVELFAGGRVTGVFGIGPRVSSPVEVSNVA